MRMALWLTAVPVAGALSGVPIYSQPLGSQPVAVADRDELTPTQIAEIRDLENLVLSPDGRLLAFLVVAPNTTSNEIELTWEVVATSEQRSSRKLMDAGQPVAGQNYSGVGVGPVWDFDAKWSPNGEWIALIRGVDGNRQLWLSRSDGNDQRLISSAATDVLSFEWADNGSAIYFVEGLGLEERVAQAEANRENGVVFDHRFHVYERGRPTVPDRPAGGTEADFVRTHMHEYDLKRVNLGGGSISIASPEERRWYRETFTGSGNQFSESASELRLPFTEVRNSSIQAAPDGRSAVWLERENQDLAFGPNRLFAWSEAVGTAPISCNTSPHCVGYWFSSAQTLTTPAADRVVFQQSRNRIYRTPDTFVWDLRANEVTQLQDHRVSLDECTIDDQNLYCVHSAAFTPPEIAKVSLESGDILTLFRPNRELGQFERPTFEELDWEIADGQRMYGRLLYPLNYVEGERYPLVVTCYNTGGFFRGGNGQVVPLLVLSARDYFVLECGLPHYVELEFRNSATRPEEWVPQLGLNPDRYHSWAMGISAGIDLLDRRGLIDNESVAMAGHSNGSYATAQLLIDEDVLSAAVMLTHTPSEMTALVLNNPSLVQMYENVGAGPGSGAWDYQNFALYADQVEAPVLLQASESEMLGAIKDHHYLTRASVPSELIVYSNEYHGKKQPAHKLAIYERSLDWIEFWLRGIEDPNPSKSARYERWAQMRDVRCAREDLERPAYCEFAQIEGVADGSHGETHSESLEIE